MSRVDEQHPDRLRSERLGARHAIEGAFHDYKAHETLRDFYVFNPLELADSYSVSLLGSLAERRLLEIGCGTGRLSVQFARSGAYVTAIDISPEMIKATREAARAANVDQRVTAVHMAAEALQFPDASFDLVYGHSILHHLELDDAARVLYRMLKPGGQAVFLEPLGHNPALKIFRWLTPNRRTPTEQPLTLPRLKAIARVFDACEHREFYLTALSAFVWYYAYKDSRRFRSAIARFQRIDDGLFSLLPYLRRFAWVSVIAFRKH